MKQIILLLGLLLTQYSLGQTGVYTAVPKATLDVMAAPADLTKKDGIIAPRLIGDELKAKDALYTDNLDGAIVYVTQPVTLQGIKTMNLISTGYFYYDKKSHNWTKLNAEPWISVSTSYPASSNTQDIYHMGNVSINNPKPYVPLNITGSGNIGTPHNDVLNGIKPMSGTSLSIGTSNLIIRPDNIALGQNNLIQGVGSVNSMAIGESNSIDQSTSALTMGDNNTLSKAHYSFVGGTGNKTDTSLSFIFGTNNIIKNSSVSFGDSNISSNVESVTIGTQNVSNGLYSTCIGSNLIADGSSQLIIGKYNYPNADINDINPPIFQVAIGDSDTNRKNALTVSDISGKIRLDQLKGTQNAYACLDAAGNLFRSTTPCIP
ncbi:hypothetical protein [Chryseobacterium sp. IT-36CA2]|uniref:hypothetical protein n=1 Tax=Chryseobacterium sp. IT-36CA2 TaxID=3026460 RepID=UPI0039E0B9AA